MLCTLAHYDLWCPRFVFVGYSLHSASFLPQPPQVSFNSIYLKSKHININNNRFGERQETGYNLLAIFLVFLVVLLCLSIPLNKTILAFQKTLQNSLKHLIIILILTFVVISAIALVLERVYGSYIMEFSSFSMAFYETIFVYFFGDYAIE